MRAEDFELLYRLEETYWWFAAMRRITDTIAAPDLARFNLKILDAGCGTGFNLGYYAAGSHDVYGLDIASDALEHVLNSPADAAEMARRARAFVEKRTWERAGDQVEEALRHFMGHPAVIRPAADAVSIAKSSSTRR